MNTPAFAPTTPLAESYLEAMLTAPMVVGGGAPEHPELAVVDIDAAANAPGGVATSWDQAQDEATKLSSGFDYAVTNAQCWRDATGSAWFGNTPEVEITCPVGFEGTVYYHFHDWNSAGRSAHIYFEGRDMGPLGDHSGDGVWFSQEATATDTADGRIHLRAQSMSGPNIMIARIMLMPRPVIQPAEPPDQLGTASIHVDAAANAPVNVITPWNASLDDPIRIMAGFDYAITGAECWRDAVGSAWFGTDYTIEFTCPVGFEGTAYYHFHDWNASGREAGLRFENREVGLLEGHVDGVWVAVPVTSDDTLDGTVSLAVERMGGPNVMVTEVALIPSS